MTEMTERLKPLGEMFGLPQDFNEDTKDKVTELKISHLKDYHKGNLGENRYSKQDLEDLVESVKINGIMIDQILNIYYYTSYNRLLEHRFYCPTQLSIIPPLFYIHAFSILMATFQNIRKDICCYIFL